MEIKKPIEKLEDGSCVIRDDHTIADIARWIIENEWHQDIMYFIIEELESKR